MQPQHRTVVLHCTMTAPGEPVSLWKLSKQALNAGYYDPENLNPFHFLIQRNSRVVEGRPLDKPGAHPELSGLNSEIVNVVLVGGAHPEDRRGQNNFTPRQLSRLRSVLKSIVEVFTHPVLVLGCDALTDVESPAFDWWKTLEEWGINEW